MILALTRGDIFAEDPSIEVLPFDDRGSLVEDHRLRIERTFFSAFQGGGSGRLDSHPPAIFRQAYRQRPLAPGSALAAHKRPTR